MDVRNPSRERVFSILNDNECPSFVIRQRRSSPSPDTKSTARSTKQERPSLPRQAQYKRSSFSESSAGSPPLLRFDSSSSRSDFSSRSMNSTPSPTTPAYTFGEPVLLPNVYDTALRQDVPGYLPSPSTITPFMEAQMMVAPNGPEPFPTKALQPLPPVQYTILPAPPQADIAQLPTPASSHNSVNSSISNAAANKTSPTSGNPPPKKNKYPCPYAQSHNCSATFTTSGHAARHGKKHTGEKGVHCPVCNKAFTRKDNMKQHERTHKGSVSGSNSDDSHPRRSNKALVTREAQKGKQLKKQESGSTNSSISGAPSSIHPSPLPEVTPLAPASAEVPIAPATGAAFYAEPANTMAIPTQILSDGTSPNTLYPPLLEDPLLAGPAVVSSPQDGKPMDVPVQGLPTVNAPPTLVRGFSDLDTLAQAAESFDPYSL